MVRSPGRFHTKGSIAMVATHNVKVNGKWYAAGEYIPDGEPEQIQAELPVEEPAEKPEVKAEAKPKTSRRKVSK